MMSRSFPAGVRGQSVDRRLMKGWVRCVCRMGLIYNNVRQRIVECLHTSSLENRVILSPNDFPTKHTDHTSYLHCIAESSTGRYIPTRKLYNSSVTQPTTYINVMEVCSMRRSSTIAIYSILNTGCNVYSLSNQTILSSSTH